VHDREDDPCSLIERAHAGDPSARERLLESFRNYLRLLAHAGLEGTLQDKADPSDLVQETLLKAHASFGQFRGGTEAELAGWLRQILARNLTDLTRRFHEAKSRRVSRERSLEELLDQSSLALGKLIAIRGPSPSEHAQQRELSVVLADALADLSPDHRQVIVLRSLEEKDWDEVACKMGRTTGAVRILWARALTRLRPLIEARLGSA
jgi:RNA polymerase sigma-70 factor (ECF subfamily)